MPHPTPRRLLNNHTVQLTHAYLNPTRDPEGRVRGVGARPRPAYPIAHTTVPSLCTHNTTLDLLIHTSFPQGECEVWVRGPGHPAPQRVARYSPGSAFGELALLYAAPRAATVRATKRYVRNIVRQLYP